MNYLFDVSFYKLRLDWLKNNDGNKLELDVYNEQLIKLILIIKKSVRYQI